MRVFWVLLCLVLPLQALALSCLEHSLTRTFEEVQAAPETYIIVAGHLNLDTRKLPKTDFEVQNAPALTRIPAKLSGTSMSRTGFNAPFSQKITLEVACFGPWCGGAQNGMEILAFLRLTGDGYALAIDPCGGHMFTNQRELQHQVLRCFNGSACRD